MMKTLFLFTSVSIASGVLFVNFYNSFVDAKSWGSDIPHSIATAREYFKAVTPGNFFRIISPLNQVFALLALVLFWKASPGIRLYLGMALILYVLSDALTFGYFYPRNDFMFRTAQLSDADALKKACSEWTSMNWVRSVIVLAGLVCSFLSLHKYYILKWVAVCNPAGLNSIILGK